MSFLQKSYSKIVFLSLIFFLPYLHGQDINTGNSIVSDTVFYDTFEDMSNWTLSGPEGLTNWYVQNSNQAGGGSYPELVFSWDPIFYGYSYLLSPVIPSIIGHNLEITFHYYLAWWSNYPTVGIAYTTDDGINYTSVWEKSYGGNYGPDVDTIVIQGYDNLRIALYYTGDSNDIDFWYVDDFLIKDVAPVPVELTSFNAYFNNDIVTLNWSTSTETNNKGFEIERSLLEKKNLNVKEWKKIGFVKGGGTTTKTKEYTFEDNNLISGIYQYRLKQIDYDGSFSYSKIIEVETISPNEYYLSQNYPNPFNPTTNINFQIAKDDFVTLKVYDLLGNEVADLINENKEAGNYNIIFNASKLTSGIYFYVLKAGNFTQAKKLILMK